VSAALLGEGLFAVIAAIAISATCAMLLSRNFVHSAVFLAAALLSFACLFALLGATFLGLLQLFIYAGAVTVVVVFVVMLTHVEVASLTGLLQPQSLLAAIAVAAFSFPLLQSLLDLAELLPRASAQAASTADLADALLTTYAAPFEISSAVLLAALVGALYLSREAA
jgi:NADH-quinone oxidoreductase subunit J